MAVSGVPLFSQQAQQEGQKEQPKQQAPAEAGGPQGDLGPIAVPKKKEEPPPPPPPKPKTEDIPNYSISVDVPLVNLDVMVMTKDGQFVPGLKKEHFRVLEDGVPQPIQQFSLTEAPITAVLLIEFSNAMDSRFLYDALNAAYAFADGLKKDDWVAVIEYDMRSQILLDFTQDKNAVYGALNQLRVPGFRESNIFDALYDTLDRVDRIEGRKEIIIVGSGRDTFSRITYDKILKKIKDTPNTTIFTVSTGRAFLEWLDTAYGSNYRVRETMLDYLQADNQMSTFAKLTGGRWYNPRFEAEFREIFADIANSVRNQYTIAYRPTNSKQDGTYRKLKVELVAPGTDKPLVIRNEKQKELKYNVIAREGYTAKNVVE